MVSPTITKKPPLESIPAEVGESEHVCRSVSHREWGFLDEKITHNYYLNVKLA